MVKGNKYKEMLSKARIILFLSKYLGWNMSLLNYVRIVLPYGYMIQFEHIGLNIVNEQQDLIDQYSCSVKFFGVPLWVDRDQFKRLVKMFCLGQKMILMEPFVNPEFDQYILGSAIVGVRIVEASAGKSLPGRTKEFTLEVFVNVLKRT